MDDLISRKAAIDALGEKPCGDSDWDLGCLNQWEWDTEILRTLPSVEPGREKGEWIKVGHWGMTYKCNQCGNYLDFDGVNAGRGDVNFCPNCGADMRGGDAE